ncbi:hypothetical protein WICPIJ_006001 [Wickerhamomyces pijperi]|uniref:Uncharacterized protein n=1 Tax=Wickerhamomyces pijperi TaxID=599730 RepID=A0A9P8Q313_WICPI|nr:hypothetical protein WICPIJ_006001 [Wickerhamomyces pijperi]
MKFTEPSVQPLVLFKTLKMWCVPSAMDMERFTLCWMTGQSGMNNWVKYLEDLRNGILVILSYSSEKSRRFKMLRTKKPNWSLRA